jgi:CRISPR-associated protein Csd1
MILQELVAYYRRKNKSTDPKNHLPPFGFERKEIPFVIQIDRDGRVLQLRDTRYTEGKKQRTASFLVPQGVKRTAGVSANLLWDSANYAIGIEKAKKGKTELTPHQAFMDRIYALPPEVQLDTGIRAVLSALDRADWSVLQQHPAWSEIQESYPVMTFQLLGDLDLVCQRPAVVAAVKATTQTPPDASTPQAMCLVDGTHQAIERLHASIKGVWGAQTTGANIISFNARAFESYGKTQRQGENAPVGERSAFEYTTALNHLLSKDSRNRVQVGDASTVFWTDASSTFDGDEGEFSLSDLFEDDKDDPDRHKNAVQALYQAVHSGKDWEKDPGGGQVRFFVLGLSPNASRISVRFWLCAPLKDLAPRILQHFEDLAIVNAPSEAPSLFMLLRSLALQGKLDNVPPQLAGDWMRAILEGLPLPRTLLNAAVNRCKAEREVTALRAAILKAWLNRDHRRHSNPPLSPLFNKELDMDQTDTAYRLGRLFAVLERTQQAALPGINATICDRYYNAASSNPVTVIPTLIRLSNAHLNKLPDGQKIYFKRLIGETLVPVNEFPNHLALPQQARFALGYYHQRQDFFKRKADAETPVTEAKENKAEEIIDGGNF